MDVTTIILYLLIGVTVIAVMSFVLIYKRFYKEVKNKESKIHELELENKSLQSTHKAQEGYQTIQEQNFKEQLKLMKSEFAMLSESITKERADELTKYNKNEMNTILTPLKENIAKMEAAISNSDKENAERVLTLNMHIANLMEQTNEVGTKADNLSEALRQNKKLQGNWGETLLENILQDEGWMRDKEYFVQKRIETKKGTIIPDFLITLPDHRAVVIDSKVSLNAYVDYSATKDPEEQMKYANLLVGNMRKQINDLADHQYNHHIKSPYVALDFVIMYVPITSALQLALETDPKLWRDAYKKGVFIASNHNLMAAIHIIDDLWAQDKQNKNIEQIVEHARHLLDRVKNFDEHFKSIQASLEDIEKSKQKAENEYDKAYRLIYDKSYGVVGSAHKIKALGAKTSANVVLPDTVSD